MKECPIPFSAPMVRAILEGRKTQTRRVMKPQPDLAERFNGDVRLRFLAGKYGWHTNDNMPPADMLAHCPYGIPGDRLWVRERARVIAKCSVKRFVNGDGIKQRVRLRYESDGAESDWIDYPERLRPIEVGNCIPNGCYREASRITLEITGIRVERLQEISEEDAKAEGVDRDPEPFDPDDQEDQRVVGYPSASDMAMAETMAHRRWFSSLWESLNGTGSWDANPWVWIVEFRRVEARP